MKTTKDRKNKELSLCGGMKPLKWISNTTAEDFKKGNGER